MLPLTSMALVGATAYLPGMHHHHHIAPFVAIWAGMFAGTVGVAVAIFAGIWTARHPQSRGFDFIASAGRIRTAPVGAREAKPMSS